LIQQIGSCLGDETLARGANVLLGPTVGMHRSPLGGRNFESFSEDPLLTGKLAAAYIRGLQSKNVAATIKHFVGNEQETQRMTINTVVEDRALREIYLKPFEIAVREANPWAIMSSYNLVNGVHSDMNHWLLQEVLSEEWKYNG
jgi:beta-glucosidase